MPLVIFCGCTAWFVSDQVRNPKDRFSHNEAHMASAACHSFYAYVKNKGADQLHYQSIMQADQPLYFSLPRYM